VMAFKLPVIRDKPIKEMAGSHPLATGFYNYGELK
jgi:hypothetical protein